MVLRLHAMMQTSGDVAPITYSIVQWLKQHPGKSFTIKDIPGIDRYGDWHRTMWRLRRWSLIKVTNKTPRNINQYDGDELLRAYSEWEQTHDINEYI